MTAEEALKLVNVNISEINRDTNEEDKEYPVVGVYEGDSITVMDAENLFFIGVFSRKKNYKVNKFTGVVEEVNIFVA